MGSKPYFQIGHIMNTLIFLVYFLLTFSSYFLSQPTSSSPDVMPVRKLSMSVPVRDHKYHETQVADEAMESTPSKEDSMTLEYTGDLVYHTDYHGVTTHPIPKHPKP